MLSKPISKALRGDTMSENTIKSSTPSLPSEVEHVMPAHDTHEGTPINTSQNTVITITFSVPQEHTITIEGIPDLNEDGVIDIQDVIIAIKQQMEKDDFESI
ncbi:MAG: hypothetical protein K0R09_930 [Clostridiales bacterium]|jgi:hypothetical protein|nr:hypothetical protein [Clostridiales bacterium]